jgi:glycosyltransferase involved in cell wall biosynthesis
MKILHLTHTDTRYDNRILKELGALTEAELYQVTCIGVASDEGASLSKNELNANIITLRLITNLVKWAPMPIRHALMLIELYVVMSILGVKFKPNIVHCHDTMVLPVGVLIKIISKAKLIYDAHELESNKNGQTKILAKATLFIEKICWRRIDHFITVSDSIISWYEKNLGVKSHSLILNSPLICEVDIVADRYFHRLYDIPSDRLVFVYLGILGPGRGIDYIIEAFTQENINSHAVFIGYGELAVKIKEISTIEKNIHFHDSLPHEEVVSIVKNADVGLCLIENVSLSDYYCLPNKLFEYAFARLPILASDFPDILAVVNKYDLGKVCAINSKSINKAVHELEFKPPNPITADLTELGWPEQAKRLNILYLELLKK